MWWLTFNHDFDLEKSIVTKDCTTVYKNNIYGRFMD